MAFEFQKLEIEEVILVKTKIFGDDRGFLWKLMKSQSLLNME
jgi:dTDP-4-dehydrorhamnose 3,5-epimerase-like enzyme